VLLHEGIQGNGGKAPHILTVSTRWKVVSFTARPLYSPRTRKKKWMKWVKTCKKIRKAVSLKNVSHPKFIKKKLCKKIIIKKRSVLAVEWKGEIAVIYSSVRYLIFQKLAPRNVTLHRTHHLLQKQDKHDASYSFL